MVLGQATRNELTHPLGMRLTAAVGWGSGLLRIVRHHVPDFAALRQSFAARPSNHRTCVRAAQLMQGCVDPTTVFEAAALMASIENRWPYGLSRRFKAASYKQKPECPPACTPGALTKCLTSPCT